jgi:hypothetical protein
MADAPNQADADKVAETRAGRAVRAARRNAAEATAQVRDKTLLTLWAAAFGLDYLGWYPADLPAELFFGLLFIVFGISVLNRS